MEIHVNNLRDLVFSQKRFSKFKDLSPDELRAQRKQNKDLDWALYDADKAQMLMDLGKEKMIALKIARGEKLSDEEQKFMEKNNPDLLEKAKMAIQQANNLKQSNKSNDNNAIQVLSSIQALSKYDEEYSQLLLEAYNSKSWSRLLFLKSASYKQDVRIGKT